MSCRVGSGSRSRGQKHQNRSTFKNSLHDTSQKTKQINSLKIIDVCQRCQDVLNWKIKYKKYKAITQPKTCTVCHMKNIKSAYHILCVECAHKLKVCCKCGKGNEVIVGTISEQEKEKVLGELQLESEQLPERKRRTYQRYIEKINSKKKPRPNPLDPLGELEEEEEPVSNSIFNNDEIISMAKKKLEQIVASGKGNDEFDDLDDSDDDM